MQLIKPLILGLGLTTLNAHAIYKTTIVDAQHQRSGAWVQALPYAFYSENFQWAAGVGVGAAGYIQPNLTFIGSLMTTSNKSSMAFLYAGDYQLPFANRVFIDSTLYKTDYTQNKQYINGNANYPNQHAGSNDSSIDNHLMTHTQGDDYSLRIRYVLPIGHSKHNAVHHYKVKNGEVVDGYASGGTKWNPLTSGRTILQLEPYYWSQDVGEYNSQQQTNKSVGFKFEAEYDNRNYIHNPTQGSRSRISITKDWGDDERPQWWMWNMDYSKYLSLGSSAWAQQQVLAFSFSTADTPSWNQNDTINGQSINQRPAWFAGVTLGGMYQLQGYENARFHDRASIYYSTEYRFTPKWNPLPSVPLINWFNTPAWYWVAFAEIGRVAEEYNLRTLHQDMKYSVGGSLRLTVESIVLRGDIAVSADDSIFRVGINHPF